MDKNSDFIFCIFYNKTIQKDRRMVVDYWELIKVNVRKFSLSPNSDYVKRTVADNELIWMVDIEEDFNKMNNEKEIRNKLTILSAGRYWFLRRLIFGPTNGPEDFQEFVFTVFQRRLYNDWFLFVDSSIIFLDEKELSRETCPEAKVTDHVS